MRAVLCVEHGPPEALVVSDVPSPQAGSGEVVVSVKACGVNFPDVLVIQGKYQFRPALPFSPGAEVAGVVKETGDGVTALQPGDRVIASVGMGGFAEEVACAAGRAMKMPDAMDFPTGATFLLGHGTSHYALRDRARLQPGETLLVLGAAGGVGLAAVEIGAAMGARVIAAASSPEKLKTCIDRGASDTIDYAADDLRTKLRELAPDGVDVVYDPVGGPYAEPALRSMAWDGRYLVIGFAAGDIPRIPLNLPLLKSCSIVGVFWGAFTMRDPERNAALLEEMFEWWAQGKIAPYVSETYPIERAAEALRAMMERRVRGKIALVM
jgi:NADPH2:quinone reductase